MLAILLIVAALAAATAGEHPAFVPKWTAPIPNGSKPLAGLTPVAGVESTRLYKASPPLGTYDHAAMILFYDGMLLATWKNGVEAEDRPGQRVMYSQSTDGSTWTPADGSNIMFPNMSTSQNPAHLFASPPIVLNGHVYAGASPIQFCLFPDQYQPQLLLRRVNTDKPKSLGTPFWASGSIPPGFEEASRLRGVKTLGEMDTETQKDVALLTPKSRHLPCADDLAADHTTKCEACAGGCQDWKEAQKLGLGNERTHYKAKDDTDVLLYRSNKVKHYYASTRSPGSTVWSDIVATNIPDIDSNLNSGPLPDGRTYLVSNAVPNGKIRDPLTVATTLDGKDWSAVKSAISCKDLAPGGNCSDPCTPCYKGRSKGGGPQYPQGVVVQGAPGFKDGLYVIISNNKEDIWVIRLPLGAF